MRTIKISVCLLLGFFVFSIAGKAQPTVTSATEQQQDIQRNMEQQQTMRSLRAGTNAPDIYAGESSDVGPQHILRLVPRRTYFEVRADSEYLYSDNVFLTKTFRQPGTIFVNTVSAAFAPPAYRVGEGRLSPTAGFLSQWYNYGMTGPDLSAFKADFDVQSAFVGAKYLVPGDWTFFGELAYNRYVLQQNYSEFYHDFTPTLGIQRLVKLRNNLILVASVRGDYHKSWNNASFFNDSEDRGDATLALTLNYQVVPRLVLQPYYQYQYTRYRWNAFHSRDRDDRLNSVGMAVAYYFTPYISLHGFANYNDKQSSDAFSQEYHEFNLGGNLTATFRF